MNAFCRHCNEHTHKLVCLYIVRLASIVIHVACNVFPAENDAKVYAGDTDGNFVRAVGRSVGRVRVSRIADASSTVNDLFALCVNHGGINALLTQYVLV
jgi:hypothetical protein